MLERAHNPSTTHHRLNGKQIEIRRLQDCAHFHYDCLDLNREGDFAVRLFLSDFDLQVKNIRTTRFTVIVNSNGWEWLIYRSYEEFLFLDKYIHACCFSRASSQLIQLPFSVPTVPEVYFLLDAYLCKVSKLLDNRMNCSSVLNWFQMDNKGNKLTASSDDSPVNIPAKAAAAAIRPYKSNALDELSFESGTMISVIDMPPLEESRWWRGKKVNTEKGAVEVGYFPSDCVKIIGQNEIYDLTNLKSLKPVRVKHGKLITFLRTFFSSRPSRIALKQAGIVKERVFGCDLGEHLHNLGCPVPKVLEVCSKFIEKYGIVDGIYRLNGSFNNIQKLRQLFDERDEPDIENDTFLNDVHSVSSVLKMYFRELPIPLLTYELYDRFVNLLSSSCSEHNKGTCADNSHFQCLNAYDTSIGQIKEIIEELPPPNYRTLSFLMKHLSRLSQHKSQTNMTAKNLAIVWAPNLLKGKKTATASNNENELRFVQIIATLTENLIYHWASIFDISGNKDNQLTAVILRPDCRPQSMCANLITISEAQSRFASHLKTQESNKKQCESKSKNAKKTDAPRKNGTLAENQQSSLSGRKFSNWFKTGTFTAGPNGTASVRFKRKKTEISNPIGGFHHIVAFPLPSNIRKMEMVDDTYTSKFPCEKDEKESDSSLTSSIKYLDSSLLSNGGFNKRCQQHASMKCRFDDDFLKTIESLDAFLDSEFLNGVMYNRHENHHAPPPPSSSSLSASYCDNKLYYSRTDIFPYSKNNLNKLTKTRANNIHLSFLSSLSPLLLELSDNSRAFDNKDKESKTSCNNGNCEDFKKIEFSEEDNEKKLLNVEERGLCGRMSMSSSTPSSLANRTVELSSTCPKHAVSQCFKKCDDDDSSLNDGKMMRREETCGTTHASSSIKPSSSQTPNTSAAAAVSNAHLNCCFVLSNNGDFQTDYPDGEEPFPLYENDSFGTMFSCYNKSSEIQNESSYSSEIHYPSSSSTLKNSRQLPFNQHQCEDNSSGSPSLNRSSSFPRLCNDLANSNRTDSTENSSQRNLSKTRLRKKLKELAEFYSNKECMENFEKNLKDNTLKKMTFNHSTLEHFSSSLNQFCSQKKKNFCLRTSPSRQQQRNYLNEDVQYHTSVKELLSRFET